MTIIDIECIDIAKVRFVACTMTETGRAGGKETGAAPNYHDNKKKMAYSAIFYNGASSKARASRGEPRGWVRERASIEGWGGEGGAG